MTDSSVIIVSGVGSVRVSGTCSHVVTSTAGSAGCVGRAESLDVSTASLSIRATIMVGASVSGEPAVDKALVPDLSRDGVYIPTCTLVGTSSLVGVPDVHGLGVMSVVVSAGGPTILSVYSVKIGMCVVTNYLFELPLNRVVSIIEDAVMSGGSRSAP